MAGEAYKVHAKCRQQKMRTQMLRQVRATHRKLESARKKLRKKTWGF